MARDSYTSPSVCSTTAEFRARGLELSDMLTALGFPKSADTGQMDWGTVNKPGTTNTAAGYEIRYLNDSLHGTKPCYVKFEFGVSVLDRFNIWATIGSGTNGSGTISGAMMARREWLTGSTAQTGDYPTFICVLPGYVGIAYKRRGQVGNIGMGFFAICRTVDVAGVPNSAGFHFYYTTNSVLQRSTYVTSEIMELQNYCHYPSLTSTPSLVGSDVQLIRHFGLQPTNRCVPFLLSYRDAELGSESEATFTPMGSTARVYLTLGGTAAPTNCSANNTADIKLMMQYEV